MGTRSFRRLVLLVAMTVMFTLTAGCVVVPVSAATGPVNTSIEETDYIPIIVSITEVEEHGNVQIASVVLTVPEEARERVADTTLYVVASGSSLLPANRLSTDDESSPAQPQKSMPITFASNSQGYIRVQVAEGETETIAVLDEATVPSDLAEYGTVVDPTDVGGVPVKVYVVFGVVAAVAIFLALIPVWYRRRSLWR